MSLQRQQYYSESQTTQRRTGFKMGAQTIPSMQQEAQTTKGYSLASHGEQRTADASSDGFHVLSKVRFNIPKQH